MDKKLSDYIDKIKLLPIKNKYSKEDILINDFLIEEENNLKIYYAPHNEYINNKAKVFIVGITPGFEQMSASMKVARTCIEDNMNMETIIYKCKAATRLSGSMKKNIINMLDEVKLNDALNINSCIEIFEDKDYLLHTTSLVPYPLFIKDKNYTGHSPKLIKSDFLMKYVYNNFVSEVKYLNNVLIIPLGKAVEEVIELLIEKDIIKEDQVLKGFPHPSGANAHRVNQLKDNKDKMINKINGFFNR